MPLAYAAGHDLNYIAIGGSLHAIGRKGDMPVAPLNLIGDYGGGAMFLVAGMLAALHEVGRSGQGQVIDAAMFEGAAYLMTSFYGQLACGTFSTERGTNVTDGGAYYYETYACSDGELISLAPIELKFRAEFFSLIGMEDLRARLDALPADEAKPELAALFASRTRAEWSRLLEGTDCCFAPVLSMEEAPRHSHAAARNSFIEIDDIVQPAPTPRFSRSVADNPTPPERPGQSTEHVLQSFGFSATEIAGMQKAGAVGEAA